MNVERFAREIRTAAGLQHPRIVTVLSAGNVDGLPFYTMPYITGESLRVRLAAGQLGYREAIDWEMSDAPIPGAFRRIAVSSSSQPFA